MEEASKGSMAKGRVESVIEREKKPISFCSGPLGRILPVVAPDKTQVLKKKKKKLLEFFPVFALSHISNVTF